MTKKIKTYDEQFKVGYCRITIQPHLHFNFRSDLRDTGKYVLRMSIRWQNEFKNNEYNSGDWVLVDLGNFHKTDNSAMAYASSYLKRDLRFKKEKLEVSGWSCVIGGQSRLGKTVHHTQQANKARHLARLKKEYASLQ